MDIKHFFILSVFLLLSKSLLSQEFLWATSFEIPNCNEVAALTIDSTGNVFLSGVYNASQFLPYTGDCYLIKTNPEGLPLWTKYFTGTLQIGDMVAMGNSIMIISQSNGYFIYDGQQYGNGSYYMFIIKIDSEGNHVWHFTDDTKNGARANLEAGKFGTVAMNIRGTSNIGDWIWIIDENGGLLKSKQISTSTGNIIDLAYYDDRVYLNGVFTGPGSLIIDTIVINLPPIENATFVLALDENLISEWVAVDAAINNHDGRIEADEYGIYAYQTVIEPPFTLENMIKRFNPEGDLLAEIIPPTFTNSVALYPDMAFSADHLGFFTENDFNFYSHKLILFDHNLNEINNLVINGPSDLYSGQVAGFGEDLFVAHVYSGDLDFNGQLELLYNGSGKKPYLAKAGMPSVNTLISEQYPEQDDFMVFPNPANDFVTAQFKSLSAETRLTITDLQGRSVYECLIKNPAICIDIRLINSGLYIMKVAQKNGKSLQKKFIVL